MAICICCAQSAPVELHHVARRLHPQQTPCKPSCVKVPVCQPDHQILTLWQSERTWPPARVRPYSPAWGDRLVTGAIDVCRLACLRTDSDSDRMAMVADWLDSIRRKARFTVRPSRVMPDIEPASLDIASAEAQCRLLDTMSDDVFAKARIRVGFTFHQRKAG